MGSGYSPIYLNYIAGFTTYPIISPPSMPASALASRAPKEILLSKLLFGVEIMEWPEGLAVCWAKS